jgi:SpoVK/Ycf46/Vps4 family AAA+-type ATPase
MGLEVQTRIRKRPFLTHHLPIMVSKIDKETTMLFRTRARRTSRALTTGRDITPLAKLWLLRILVPLHGHKGFIEKEGFTDDRLAEVLGLSDWLDVPDLSFKPQAVRMKLKAIHSECEHQLGCSQPPSPLVGNVTRIAKLAGLSDIESRILIFAIMLRHDSWIEEATGLLGDISNLKLFHVLSILLDAPEEAIREALRQRGALSRSGLLKVDPERHSLRHKFELLSETFTGNIVTFESDPIDLLQGTVAPSAPPQLGFADYCHVEETLKVLRLYLKQSLASGRTGVNIFLYGPPGTGKTQLARVLAKDLGCELFEVASEDSDGDSISGATRLRAFRAAQCFFARRHSMLLFDEVEDIFQGEDMPFFSLSKPKAEGSKAWINRMLETNPVPTLWLSNSAHTLDPAFIRRFDMVLELPIPPQGQREKIVQAACGDMLDKRAIARIADSEALSPAIIMRAASVARAIRDDVETERIPAMIESLVSSTLEAQGHPPIRRNDPNALPETYDPAFINSDVDLGQVTEGLIKTRTGRLCLYGPPGTGKTAYGRWLAERMGVPLLIKRVSDLQSKWLGEAEKNIANAFKEAEQSKAVLLIDEVDSFLQDRRNAERSWEISQVNEMLTQMEAFAGVFIASTNLMEGLDQASLRRFDLKVRFDFLKPTQSRELLRRQCRSFGIQPPANDLGPRLARMTRLTPGDFTAVARQHRFRPIGSVAELLAALEAECAIKEGSGTTIGFL